MTPLRIHYLVKAGIRCGNPGHNWTVNPGRVTCESCKKLMKKELQS